MCGSSHLAHILDSFIDWVQFLDEYGVLVFIDFHHYYLAPHARKKRLHYGSWRPDRGEVEFPQVCAGNRDTTTPYKIHTYIA